MTGFVRYTVVGLLLLVCSTGVGSAQTISGSGVVYSAATPLTIAATFNANGSVSGGKASGTIIVDFAATTFSGFVTNVTVSAPNSKGVIVTTVTSEGYLTVNATKAQSVVASVAVFVQAPGSRGALTFMLANYSTGAVISTATYNIITGGVGVSQ